MSETFHRSNHLKEQLNVKQRAHNVILVICSLLNFPTQTLDTVTTRFWLYSSKTEEKSIAHKLTNVSGKVHSNAAMWISFCLDTSPYNFSA